MITDRISSGSIVLSSLGCPACGQPMQELGTVPMRDFDGALFNRDGLYRHCSSCGMSRVDYELTDEQIAEHYARESLYSELSGVGVGGDNAEDQVRYAHYLNFMRDAGLAGGLLADIGCARGGFLRFLANAAPEINSLGVDCDARSLKGLEDHRIDARVGDVFSLPLQEGEADVASYLHVLEHLYDVDAALAEALRVIRPGGALLIEVPDAAHYFTPETSVGPMFWLGMKEHINHFTPEALAKILMRNNLSIAAVDRSAQPMKDGNAYPSLLVIARKNENADFDTSTETFDRGPDFASLFDLDIDSMRQMAAELAASQSGPIAFWGIGLEFFALYGYLEPMLGGREVQFLDSNPSKQGLTVGGFSVTEPSAAIIGGTLVCCSYLSAPEIVEEALKLGWKRQQIRCLPSTVEGARRAPSAGA